MLTWWRELRLRRRLERALRPLRLVAAEARTRAAIRALEAAR